MPSNILTYERLNMGSKWLKNSYETSFNPITMQCFQTFCALFRKTNGFFYEENPESSEVENLKPINTMLKSTQFLRNALLSPPAPSHFNSTSHITHSTDPCDVQGKWVLIQDQPNITVKSTGFRSKSPTGPGRWYGIKQWESFAVVWDVLLVRRYLQRAKRFLVYS